jgi:hypothetical protein
MSRDVIGHIADRAQSGKPVSAAGALARTVRYAEECANVVEPMG